MRKIDKFTTRGIIFIAISIIGLGYEFLFADQIKMIVIIGYVFIVGIGLVCIFQLKEM